MKIQLAVLVVTLASVTATAAEKSEKEALPEGAVKRLAAGSRLRDLEWLPSGKLMALGMSDHCVHEWDPATGKELRSLAIPKEHKQTDFESLSPDGKTLAFVSQSAPEAIVLWDLDSGKQRTLIGHGRIDSLRWSPDGTVLGSNCGASIRIWDAATGKEKRSLQGHIHGIWCLSAAGKLVVAHDATLAPGAAAEGQCDLCTIDSASGKKLHAFRIMTSRFFASWSPDGKTLAIPCDLKGVQLLDPAVAKIIRSIESCDNDAVSVSWAPDGKTLASTNREKIFLCDVASGKKIHTFTALKANLLWIAFSPDGKWLATHDISNHNVIIWKVPARQPAVKINLDDSRFANLWNDLGGKDAAKVDQAVWSLVAAQDDGAKMLARELKPVLAPDTKLLARLIKDLDDPKFKVRERARIDLEKLGESICPTLRKTLACNPSAEVKKRVEELLAKLDSWPGMPLRTWRALAVLERNGSQEAKELLQKLAKGSDTPQAQEARLAVQRLDKLKSMPSK